MTTIDQHRQLDHSRPAVVTQCIERGPDRPAGIEHVVDQHDDGVVDPAGRDCGLLQGARRVQPEVVAVQRDVQGTDERWADRRRR